ncbi:unnamed protein product [Hymenolepis diminuta]|uniref:Uncharacterized protein n=1 Tax=Hymenolepis diminuta TaxID=6216 RepID=A0A564YK30_HYMDI|nr:unnamed protein product [Hymenolepis diminuta]
MHAGTRYSSLSSYPGFSPPLFREASRRLALPHWPSLVLSMGWLVISGMQRKERNDWLI